MCGCAVKKQSVGCCLLAMAPEGKQEKAAGGLSARTQMTSGLYDLIQHELFFMEFPCSLTC